MAESLKLQQQRNSRKNGSNTRNIGTRLNRKKNNTALEKYFRITPLTEDTEDIFEQFIRQQFICELLLGYYYKFIVNAKLLYFWQFQIPTHIRKLSDDEHRVVSARLINAFNLPKFKHIYEKYLGKEIVTVNFEHGVSDIYMLYDNLPKNDDEFKSELFNDIFTLCDINYVSRDAIIRNIKGYCDKMDDEIIMGLKAVRVVLQERYAAIFHNSMCRINYCEMLDVKNNSIPVISVFVFLTQKQAEKVKDRLGIHYYITRNIIYDLLPLPNKLRNTALILHSYCSYFFKESEVATKPMTAMENIFVRFSKKVNNNQKPFISIRKFDNYSSRRNIIDMTQLMQELESCNKHIPSKYTVVMNVSNYHKYWISELSKI